MDSPRLVKSTDPTPMPSNLFEVIVRTAMEHSPFAVRSSPAPIEYMFDGNPTPEFKVFPTDSQKGN